VRDRRYFRDGREIDVVQAGDLAHLPHRGAYGATMASTYNSRALVPEVLVMAIKCAWWRNGSARALIAAEHVPDWLSLTHRLSPRKRGS
jgi:diaminopimelate decarboxylase